MPWQRAARASKAGHGIDPVPPLLLRQVMSQDLIRATMEIPFSVPPYSALLGRSVASLEGIALLGDPNYQARPILLRSPVRPLPVARQLCWLHDLSSEFFSSQRKL